MIFDSEKVMDNNRKEYAAYMKEYEEQVKAFEADSISYREIYHRDRPEYEPRGAIGFNIGGAFFLVFALFMLVPLAIGILLLLYYRYKKRKWLNTNNF